MNSKGVSVFRYDDLTVFLEPADAKLAAEKLLAYARKGMPCAIQLPTCRKGVTSAAYITTVRDVVGTDARMERRSARGAREDEVR